MLVSILIVELDSTQEKEIKWLMFDRAYSVKYSLCCITHFVYPFAVPEVPHFMPVLLNYFNALFLHQSLENRGDIDLQCTLVVFYSRSCSVKCGWQKLTDCLLLQVYSSFVPYMSIVRSLINVQC